MMPVLIVLITAVLLLLLFLGRRIRSRQEEVASDSFVVHDDVIVIEARAATSEAEQSSVRSVSEQIGEERLAGLLGADEPVAERVGSVDGVDAPETDWPFKPAEHDLRYEINGTGHSTVEPLGMLEQSKVTTPEEVLPSLSNKPISDDGKTINNIETPEISEVVLPPGPPALAGEPSSSPYDVPQPGRKHSEHSVEISDGASGIGLLETKTDSGEARESFRVKEGVDVGQETAPARYQPPAQRPPRQVNASAGNQKLENSAISDVSLEIRVRLRFDRSGFCEFSLLPVRKPELDNEVEVKSGRVSLLLVSQEDWYQDLQFEDIGRYLSAGLELKGVLADHRRVRWLLKGRDIYVLASHPRASYFVSTAQLALGRTHIVMCLNGMLTQVEGILNEAGCQAYTKLDETHGVPPGWEVLCDVAPTKAIPLDAGIDPFYAIKPAPNADIDLEGGVCLRNSVWLAGYPPRVQLLGLPSTGVNILFDGKHVQPDEDGRLIVDGYDLPGQHSVYCEGMSCSRSYSIEEAPESWKEWPAYRFGDAEICGPLVELLHDAAERRVITVPMSNPLLLGAVPGQIFWCSSRNVARWKGFVPFDVVWALPAHPLVSDKKTARILQLANAPVDALKARTGSAGRWSNAILDASRKGLRIDTEFSGSAASWSQYKKLARSIRKGWR